MKAKARWRSTTLLLTALSLSVCAHAAQTDLQKLTVGYTPISGAALPFFIAVEEKIFQKYGLEVSPVFMGGSPLINSAILAGEFPIGYTGGGAVLSSHFAGSDLIAIACPLSVLTIDGWSRPEIRSITDLRGKSIGVTRFGASTHFAALSMLESAGVKPNEVAFIQNGGVGESLAALMGSRVDAAMIGYPFGVESQTCRLSPPFPPLTDRVRSFSYRRHCSAGLMGEGPEESQRCDRVPARAQRRTPARQRKCHSEQTSIAEIYSSHG